MAHLPSCRLLHEACTADDLATVTERAMACARKWDNTCVKDTKEEEELDLFQLLSHFSFSSAQLPLPMPLLVVLLRGLFVLLQLGRCHIILSRILLFVP